MTDDWENYCPWCKRELIDLHVPDCWPYCNCPAFKQAEEDREGI